MSVVEFPNQEPLVFVCACGCATLFCLDNGTVECPSCGVVHEGGWAPKPARLMESIEADECHRIGEPVDVMRERFKRALDDPDILAYVAFYNTGRVHSVINDRAADTDEQKAWWRRRAVMFLRQIFL